MNTCDLPGYGDPQTWGAICSPNDPRCDDEDDAIDVIADSIFEVSVVSTDWMSAATLRAIKADAMKEARIRYERMRREDEADAAAERMGH